MTGVHSLKHVDSFTAANLTDHDAIGTHTQCVLDQISLGNFTATFDVGRSGFESDDVRLLQLKFCRVFNRDDAFVFGDVS